MPASKNAREVADLRSFPPEVVVSVKALACELPSRLGVPLSRLHVPDISAEVARHRGRDLGDDHLAVAVRRRHLTLAQPVVDLSPRPCL